MDSDIHFGELEHAEPTTRLRPDRNGQLATVPVYELNDDDLPIFVDLDVMRDMVAHAESDKRVELGGVLLGTQSADDSGQPFVIVTDCLRARHYESTKGSFKFTHDTWEQITREREQLPADLQMVGWYHTHPDWGVFLSGLDMFICDNFFNRPLDVALVIDPCRFDTGFFQWTNNADQRIRRTGGYNLFASRFRLDELHDFANELKGQAMPESTRSSNSPVNVHLSQGAPAPAWQMLLFLGMFGMQFCLLLLLAARLLPNTPDQTAHASESRADAELQSAQQREATVDAKLEVLETIARREGNLSEGILKTLAERTSEVEELRGSLRGQQSLTKETDAKVRGLETALTEARNSDERTRLQLANLQSKLDKLQTELASTREQESTGDKSATVTKQASSSWWSFSWADGRSLGFGAFLGAAAVGASLLIVMRRRGQLDGSQRESTTTAS